MKLENLSIQSYDEWVNTDRMLKLNNQNLELQKRLFDEAVNKYAVQRKSCIN